MIANPDFLVEACDGPGNYFQAARALVRCPSGSVFNERAANTPVHMFRLDEEPVELVGSVVGGDDNRETERRLAAGDGNTDPAVLDEAVR